MRRVELLLLPAVLGLPLAAGCSTSALSPASGVTRDNLRWLETADQAERLVDYREVVEQLGPGQVVEVASFEALPIPEDWARQPDITWRIWEDNSGDFILAGFDERGTLFRAAGQVGEPPP